MLRAHKVSITTVGSAGSAVGSWTSELPISGYLAALYLTLGTMPATTDTTITNDTLSLPLLTLTDYNTTGYVAPQLTCVTIAGAAIVDTNGDPLATQAIPITGHVKIAIAQGDAGTVTGFLFVEEN